MIIPTFHYYLRDNDISITDIAKRTGISRPTISALANRHNNGIRFETINSICSVYDLNIDDIFIYLPFDDICVDTTSQSIIFKTIYGETKKIKYTYISPPFVKKTIETTRKESLKTGINIDKEHLEEIKAIKNEQIDKSSIIEYQKLLLCLTDNQINALNNYLSDILTSMGNTFDKMTTLDIIAYVNE